MFHERPVSQTVASWLVTVLGVYAGLGIVFAIPFVVKGAGRVDGSAREGTWGFRVLIFPGAVALWPLLAKRWASGLEEPPGERNPHRDRTRETAS